jgi:hypothetical protein
VTSTAILCTHGALAIRAFARRYADQTERDHAQLVAATADAFVRSEPVS